MATYKDDLDIIKAAEKDANKLSLNAITELDNKGLLGMYGGGGGSGKTIPDEFGLMTFMHSGKVPAPEWGNEGTNYYLGEYITKDFNYVRSMVGQDSTVIVASENSNKVVAAVVAIDTFGQVDGAYIIYSPDLLGNTKIIFLPSGEIYFAIGGK